MIIVIDNREKRPYEFPGVETVQAHLKTGDYTVQGFEDRFAVERKSVNDLATSVGAERKRFEKEIQRAQEFDHFTVMIDGVPGDVYSGSYYSRIHPNAVMGTIEKWPYKYGTLDFEWAGTDDDGENLKLSPAEVRERAAQETLRLLDRWYLMAASDLF